MLEPLIYAHPPMPKQALSQLNRRIKLLQQQAEALRKKEVKGVIARIKLAIDHYGLTAADLGLSGKASRAPAAKKRVGKATYGDGNGRTWTGRGRRPQWFIDALAAGKAPEDLRVQ